jgi:hydrogenase-4 component B
MNAELAIKFLFTAFVLTGTSGVPGIFFARESNWGQRIALAANVAGAIAGIMAALQPLVYGSELTFSAPMAVPGASFDVRVDAVAGAFLLPIFLVSALGALYGIEYWKQPNHVEDGAKLRLFYGIMTAGLALVVVSANGVLFLMAWEVMAIAAFFLVTTEDGNSEVREAGWIYFVASHASTLLLIAFFAMYKSAVGSFALEPSMCRGVSGGTLDALLVLGLLGFGIKAGLIPLHVWLPSAHANAPSHVSAFLSGVLIKMGVYGVIRMCWLFPQAPVWWGVALLIAGAVSGVLGVIFAIGQHDLKRLLAYHSIENIGIIFLGLGTGAIGLAIDNPVLVTLGFSGAVLHVWNHALFKSLLFYAAGSVIHSTHTREIDRLGGLSKRMPWTSAGFLVGAAAICGLPPLNGFVSEFSIYLGMFHVFADQSSNAGVSILIAFAVPSLALIGGLALACFVKVFGTAFLGEPRTSQARDACEAGPFIRFPLFVLALLCFAIGLFPLLVSGPLDSVLAVWDRGLPSFTAAVPLLPVSTTGLTLIVLCSISHLWLRSRRRAYKSDPVVTWDCGYSAPSARMQYTSSSFAQMFVEMFRWVLIPKTTKPKIDALFPGTVEFYSHVRETVLDLAMLPMFRTVADGFSRLRLLQMGWVQAYLVYIVIAFITLLVLA